MGATDLLYVRRKPDRSLLFKVISENADAYFQKQSIAGISYPGFIYKTLGAYLHCGLLDYGFVRTYCRDCCHSELVAFSCKRRGFCPSCHAKRMNESVHHLTTNVFPKIPFRQWVLSLPFELRPLIATNKRLISIVGNVFTKAVNRWLRKVAKEMSVDSAIPGSITFIQRFGGGLQSNPHYHSLFADGIYYQKNKQWFFHSIREPNKDDLISILERIVRVIKKLHKKGIFGEDIQVLGQPLGSQGFVEFMGELVAVPKTPFVDFEESGSVKLLGFSINAKVATKSYEREKLERLIRYVARGPIATDRLHEVNGKIVYIMKKTWHNGADRVAFTPEGFIQRLIALIPPARSHLIRYNGVFASNFKYRNEIVPRKTQDAAGKPVPKAKKLLWAEMIASTFKIDVKICKICHGKMEPIAIIKDPKVVYEILKSMGLLNLECSSNSSRGPPTTISELDSNRDDQRPVDW